MKKWIGVVILLVCTYIDGATVLSDGKNYIEDWWNRPPQKNKFEVGDMVVHQVSHEYGVISETPGFFRNWYTISYGVGDRGIIYQRDLAGYIKINPEKVNARIAHFK